MKKLLILLFIIPVLAISQNRFTKLFSKADSAFDATEAILETDCLNEASSLALYNCITECEIDTNGKITVSERDYLNDFMNAYLMGQLAFYYNHDFNYDLLERKLKKIKSALSKIDQDTFNRPYKVKRIDEHEVQLIYKGDTVRMYLENAYQFNEQLVYIKHGKARSY